jgi:triosephosphate isomerase
MPGRGDMRRIVAGNWKMYKTRKEALSLVDALIAGSSRIPDGVELAVFPPFTALAEVAARCVATRIQVGAQNMHFAREGAYTGEVSARMLLDAGATSVLIGHSERRQHFGETDELLAHKTRAALESGLVPVFCLGETLDQREGGRTEEVLQRQLRDGLGGLGASDLQILRIAYEPVWAIGTGRTATPEQAREAHVYLRGLLNGRWGEEGNRVPLLYGGSVKPENARELMEQPEVNGVLVGGASLDPESFLRIAGA